MKVKYYDVTGPAQKEYRGQCELTECFPDDPEAFAEAEAEIKRCGQAWVGGGAAPLIILERA